MITINFLITSLVLAMVQNVENYPTKAWNRILRPHQIIFPDSEEDITEDDDKFSPIEGTPLCARRGNTFCEDVDGYPYTYVQKILNKNSSFEPFFGTDAIPDEFANRLSGSDDHFICESVQKLIFPKAGKTKGNAWQYIINQKNSPEGYVQGIQVEICKDLNSPCQLYANTVLGYVTSCKQKYIYRRLLSINKNGGTAYELFEMPSACCCSYKPNHNFLFRSKES